MKIKPFRFFISLILFSITITILIHIYSLYWHYYQFELPPPLKIIIKLNNHLEYNTSLSNINFNFFLSLNSTSTSNEFSLVSANFNIFDHLINELKNISLYDTISDESNGKFLCLLVPFRSRISTLFQFLPYIHAFLVGQHCPHLIFTLHQTDDLRYTLII